jgi:arginyl-tRNA synthetase
MKAYLHTLISDSLNRIDPNHPEVEIIIEKPRIPEHGDASTNVALIAAKRFNTAPRQLAESIVANLALDATMIDNVSIAGPGFINFKFSNYWLVHQLKNVLNHLESYGRSDSNKAKRIQVEFVSANPTGPLTVGHGRNAVLGDTIARLLEWTGASVQREYYFNDAGRQMRVLGESVLVRYQQLIGQNIELEEGFYEGEYIRDIAQNLLNEKGNTLAENEDLRFFTAAARDAMFEDIKTTLKRMHIHMDTFFNEHDLYEQGALDKVIQRLKQQDLVYEKDGATWFKTTQFGKEKDTVLIKSTGEPTYRLPDIAYHIDKLDRGYDLCIDIFGADHIATYPDVISALQALGYNTDRVQVMVYQFVTIVKEGQPFKMSTRKANFVTLDELMDEVGADVTRFFFLMRSPGTHLEFDIAQAKDASDKNPVFYLQYANARINSILRKANETYDFNLLNDSTLEALTHPAELDLIRMLLEFPEVIQKSAEALEPHRMITYLNELASSFTQFYHHCRIMGEEEKTALDRIQLLKATSAVLENGLHILGITAPRSM